MLEKMIQVIQREGKSPFTLLIKRLTREKVLPSLRMDGSEEK